MAEIRKHIRFWGRVQGVGFRYKAKYLAQSLGLTGWVKNEWDGSVTMEIQGRSMMIDKMLENLNRDRYIVIDWIDAKEIPLEDGRGFHVVG
ncbi:MAG: acylphosphatase [Lachnospiraceae bacterium]|nr:acylphosphatase [Lachnospiraceae bacterium]MDD7077269.1 acylphosphatase [Lachnospiraceae bacterium]MDY3730486.1 acylphosphatase [Candidatus Choladocola sp.]